jgi:hypothetical protein
VIRAFDILNENFSKDHAWFGVPFPGTFIIDEKGVSVLYGRPVALSEFTWNLSLCSSPLPKPFAYVG